MKTGEFKLMERKDVSAVFEVSNQVFHEEGVLFLTTLRLVYVSQTCAGVQSFQCQVSAIREGFYYKKSGQRCIGGFVFIENYRGAECKVLFKYNQTGLRSLASVLFSLIEQASKENVQFKTSDSIKGRKPSNYGGRTYG